VTGGGRGGHAPRFVLFDYGNTLVPYGRREAALMDGVVAETTARWIPGLDPGAFRAEVRAVKERLIRGTRESDREVTNVGFAGALAEAAGAAALPAGMAEDLAASVEEAFPAALRLPTTVLPVLEALGKRFRLGLLSNYYLPGAIHRSLGVFGIREHLAAAVVSAETGWVKPHRGAFDPVLEALGAAPADCIFIGDNLRADVGGAAALGMRTVHTREWLEGALGLDAEDSVNGGRPDFVIERLADLPALLDAAWPA